MAKINEEDALAPFLTPIRDLAQNFDINLGKLLQEYLDKFGLTSIGAEEVLDGVNFAEAAIVLQQSANIYGKKVDYLWQVLMQVLDSFKSKKKKEEEDAAAQKKGKPENGGVTYLSPDFCELDDDETLFDGNAAINISADYVSNPIHFLPKYNPQLEMKVAAEKKLPLYGLMNNVIGNKYDFRVNKYLSTDGLLIDEPEFKKEASASVTECDIVTKVENIQSSPSPDIKDIKNVEENDHEYPDLDIPGPSNILPEQYDDNAESSDVSLVNNVVSNVSISKEKPQESEVERRNASHRRTADKIITLDSDPWKPWPVDKQVPNKKFFKAITYKVPPDLAVLSAEQNKKTVFDKNVHNWENTEFPSIFSFFAKESSLMVKKKAGYLGCVEFYGNLSNNIPPKENLSPLEIEDMIHQMAKEFGDEYCLDLRGSSSENDFEEDDFEDEDDFIEPPEKFITAEDNGVGDLELFPKHISSETLAGAYMNHLQLESNFVATSTYEEYSREAFSVPALYGKPNPGLAAKVNEWHDAIRPKLQAANERGSFDIHGYGTKIIKKLETQSFKSPKEPLSFNDVVQGEHSEDVPRFFLAALMLANSHNVEVSKSNNIPLAMDCMNLGLLTSARHHKVFDECVDPE